MIINERKDEDQKEPVGISIFSAIRFEPMSRTGQMTDPKHGNG